MVGRLIFDILIKFDGEWTWETGRLKSADGCLNTRGLVLIFTGICLRPPFMTLIVGKKIHRRHYPSIKTDTPWHIRNALYDSGNDRLVLECADGVWAGRVGEKQPFKRISLPVRISGMGATVFEEERPGTWMIGSFSGLNRVWPDQGISTPVLQAKPKHGAVAKFVTGYIRLPDQRAFVLAHYKGICDLQGRYTG